MMRWLARTFVLSMAALALGAAAGEDERGIFEGVGTVLAVDEAKSTVTLDHGPIPGLMPAMRMRFPVERRAELHTLKKGDTVRFSLGSRGDEMVIVTIEPVAPSAPRQLSRPAQPWEGRGEG